MRITILEQLQSSKAFELVCEKWDAGLTQIQKDINDTATTDEKTRELKIVRKHLVESHHPATIVETLIKIARSDASRPSK